MPADLVPDPVLAAWISELLGSLFTFLKCLVAWAVGAIGVVIVVAVNAFIAALMFLLGPLLALLPNVSLAGTAMPGWVSAANWALPLDQFVAATGVVVAVLVVWHVISIALRWLKVVE